MNKIYAYYTLFFTGSILPFLIVTYYFQDVITMGILCGIAGVVLTFCIITNYLNEKTIHLFKNHSKKIDNLTLSQTKPEIGEFSYFFKNIL